jgi:predicted nucleic acid-binding Zn ribbon protein
MSAADKPGARPSAVARRTSSDEPMPLSDALAAVSARLGVGSANTVAAIFGRWPEIVGAAVAEHVRPLRIDRDTIVLGADHPAWATQMRQLAPQVLERIDEACGGSGAPERIEVRVTR